MAERIPGAGPAETITGAGHFLQESGSARARAAALGTQAWLSEIQGHHADAERNYRELIELYEDIGNVAGVAAAQMYIGRLLGNSDRSDEAEAICVSPSAS